MASLYSETLHATSVSIGGRAILIEGVSGAGKSDLALRLIDRGAVLVSDDYSIVERRNGQIIASAPEQFMERSRYAVWGLSKRHLQVKHPLP